MFDPRILIKSRHASNYVRHLRARKVDFSEYQLVEVGFKALLTGEWVYHCENGGDVANGYRSRASTETAVLVADPQGRIVAWRGEASANAITLRGTARSAVYEDAVAAPGFLGMIGDAWDDRCSEGRKNVAMDTLRSLHRMHVDAGRIYAIAKIDLPPDGRAMLATAVNDRSAVAVFADWLEERGETRAKFLASMRDASPNIFRSLTEVVDVRWTLGPDVEWDEAAMVDFGMAESTTSDSH